VLDGQLDIITWLQQLQNGILMCGLGNIRLVDFQYAISHAQLAALGGNPAGHNLLDSE